jgi:hypothetical protein
MNITNTTYQFIELGKDHYLILDPVNHIWYGGEDLDKLFFITDISVNLNMDYNIVQIGYKRDLPENTKNLNLFSFT